MKTAFFIILFNLSFFISLHAQDVTVLNSSQLLESVDTSSDTLYVVNFWATWCAPCVEELPIFNTKELSKAYKPIKVVLVSLDFKTQIDSKLKPFLQKKGITEKVVWLNESNPNNWVDKIDPSWSGAIPATKMYYKNQQTFHEGELTHDKLKEKIQFILSMN